MRASGSGRRATAPLPSSRAAGPVPAITPSVLASPTRPTPLRAAGGPIAVPPAARSVQRAPAHPASRPGFPAADGAAAPARRHTLALFFQRQGGFTLIELLVVIIILGLLAGLVGPRLFGRIGQSKQATARAQIELLGAGLDQYRLDVGAYPTAAQGLEALVRNPGVPNWNGPYLKKPAIPKDPWGNPYNYKCCPGDHGEYDLWSYGADSAPGGESENADATSWGSSQ